MKQRITVASLAAASLLATAYLCQAQKPLPTAPPPQAVPEATHRLTIREGDDFAQIVDVPSTGSFHIVTKIGKTTYDFAGTNRLVKTGMMVRTAVSRSETTPIAMRDGKVVNSEREQRFGTEVFLQLNDEPLPIGGTASEDSDGVKKQRTLTVSVAPLAPSTTVPAAKP